MTAPETALAEIALIDKLTEDEGHYVTIPCANPDFDGPAFVVDAFGDWTNWEEMRFDGDTRIEALQAAVLAMEIRKS
ncbi:MAG: hypothetical protein ACPGVG_05400 [Mycobacterium sp.]